MILYMIGCVARFICFVMTMTTITNQINHDIFFKAITIINR